MEQRRKYSRLTIPLSIRMKLSKKDWLDIPVIALLAANAIPLFGVLFLDWDAFYVVKFRNFGKTMFNFFYIRRMTKFTLIDKPHNALK